MNPETRSVSSHRNWEKGYMILATTPVTSLDASKARLLHIQSFAKLSQLILKFASTLENNRVSIEDIEKYFHLPPTLANYIFTNLLSEEYLISPKFSKNESAISAIINLSKYDDFETIPSEEIICPIAYNFSNFPRYYIPNHLLIEKQIRTKLKTFKFPPHLDLSSSEFLKGKDNFGIPESFIRLEEDSENVACDTGCDAIITIYPQDNGKNSLIFLKRSPLEFKRIPIDLSHPDYPQIDQIFSVIDIRQILEEYFPAIIPKLNFEIKFDISSSKWTINTINLNVDDAKTFFDTLESKIESLFTGNRVKSLRIDLPGFENYFKKVTLFCRFHFEFNQVITKLIFYEYLARNFVKFDDDLDRFEQYVQGIHEKFIKIFRISQDFSVPRLEEIRDYFWNTHQYQIAYCIMALGDF